MEYNVAICYVEGSSSYIMWSMFIWCEGNLFCAALLWSVRSVCIKLSSWSIVGTHHQHVCVCTAILTLCFKLFALYIYYVTAVSPDCLDSGSHFSLCCLVCSTHVDCTVLHECLSDRVAKAPLDHWGTKMQLIDLCIIYLLISLILLYLFCHMAFPSFTYSTRRPLNTSKMQWIDLCLWFIYLFFILLYLPYDLA